ncbi:methyltransferase domain-containing protein [Chlorobium phaeovibrioides]|uniref:Methyltransferase domain-containing protein n=1 Tax=Chlorobium phaeovibrioides TaxID=1094 RepID=A0A432AV55_CHLPH|nr:class I SAM-dependent methyltransferase [Chlorobium phaeovibrioides]RTY38344.1 methyltransferase domain-containing protein [Chlorobium phaeovibrioides]
MSDVIHRRTDCRACGCKNLMLVFRLKPSPIGDAYVQSDRLTEPQLSYPIDLFMCPQCGLAQIIDIIKPEILYGEYLDVKASSLGFLQHFQEYASSVIKRCRLSAGDHVINICSNDAFRGGLRCGNDSTFLRYFHASGMNVLGIEPASHIAAQATANGITTIGKFFTPDLAREIVATYGPAKLVTANNVFANIDDLRSWVEGVNQLLAVDGVFVFESYYLADLVHNMVFDFIYHEHLSAFSVKPIQALFQSIGLELVVVERVATKGGSLRYFVQRPGGPIANDGSVEKLLQEEESMGLYRKETYIAFADKVNALKDETKRFLIQAKSEGKSIAGFGASITGTTLIYHFEIGEYLDYLVDDNLAKQGRFSPGFHLPVLPTSALYERKPDYVVILAWRFAEPFIKNNQAYVMEGGAFVVPVPLFKVVSEHV